MKTKSDIEAIIKKHKSVLKKEFKVKSIGLFGSFARNDNTENSDVDLLVSFYEPVGWEFVDLKEYLENMLEVKVDLATEGSLKPQMKEAVLKEVLYQ